jgi:transposase-like protein
MNAETDKAYPKTLIEAVRYFADPNVALDFFVKIRWPHGVCCPRCGSDQVHFLAKYRRWECREKHPQRQFTVKVGTIMEDSPLSLDKWAVAFWLEANAKNSISSYEVHRALGITQKSAWFMQHRIRLAMKSGSFEKMGGTGSNGVEADETYVGGIAYNMHKKKRKERITGTGGFGSGKAVVMGLLERHSEKKHSTVRATVLHDVKVPTIQEIIRSNVAAGSSLYTDALTAYKGMEEYFHGFIDHAEMYVVGKVHTNGLENFWSLFKRCIKGTHVSVEPFHLLAYVDAECFRFNNRKMNDGERFVTALKGADGKRLTYKALIGALEETPGSNGSDAASGNLPA